MCKECRIGLNKTYYNQPEIKKKVAERGQIPENKERTRLANKAYKSDPKNKERLREQDKQSWERIKADPIRHAKSKQIKKEYYQENKESMLAYSKESYHNNEEVNKRAKERSKAYREDPNNTAHIKEQQRDYRLDNKEKLSTYQKERRSTPEYKEKNKVYQQEYRQKEENIIRRKANYQRRKANDPVYYAGLIIRGQLKRILKNTNKRKMQKTFSLIDYTQQELIDHLNKGEYTWDQYYGNTKEFHIDHIIPVAYYANLMLLSQSEELTAEDKVLIKKCNSLRNLRIWPAIDNMEKHDTLDRGLVEQHGIEDLL